MSLSDLLSWSGRKPSRPEVLHSWVRTNPKTVQDIAQHCLERCRNMRWHDSIEDQLALEFFLGAAVGAVAAGSTLFGNQIAWAAANVVAKRGMGGVKAIADGELRLGAVQ